MGEKDDRRPTALRARPPRGAPSSRALGLDELLVGRVVVAMRDSGDELEPEARSNAAGRAVLSGRDSNRQRASDAMRQPVAG